MRLASTLFALGIGASAAMAQVKITTSPNRVHVEIDGQPYTDFYYSEGESMKPFLWPLRSASGKIITRYYPLEKAEGEPTDHQHHRGLWYGHDNVNGVDFWNNETSYKSPPPRGRTTVEKITAVKSGAHEGSFTAILVSTDPSGTKLLDETRTMRFVSSGKLRIIDFDDTYTAATKVTFGDSKDGTLGMRLAPALQEDKVIKEKGSSRTYPGIPGTIVNAEGAQHEKDVWGKPSNWVDYFGELDGEQLGIAILDNPSNVPRARWHVRAYGLFAVNPFGREAFGDKTEKGGLTLEPGKSLRLRYRIVIHPGDAKSADIAKLWTEYAK